MQRRGPDSCRSTLEDHSDDISAVAFSPDGQAVAAWLGAKSTLSFWRVADGTLIADQPPPGTSPRQWVAFVPSSNLVVVAGGTGGDTVELAHQSLIDHWPRLRRWLAEDREFLTWRSDLDAARYLGEAYKLLDSYTRDASGLAQGSVTAVVQFLAAEGGPLVGMRLMYGWLMCSQRAEEKAHDTCAAPQRQ